MSIGDETDYKLDGHEIRLHEVQQRYICLNCMHLLAFRNNRSLLLVTNRGSVTLVSPGELIVRCPDCKLFNQFADDPIEQRLMV